VTVCAHEASESAAARRALVLRLKRIEGQLRAVQSMIESGQDCEAVAQQFSAARKALDKAFFELIACAIEHPQFAGDEPAPRTARGRSTAADPRVQRIARALAKFA
jgi:DNA-binding FrmR family transcriptional regulator